MVKVHALFVLIRTCQVLSTLATENQFTRYSSKVHNNPQTPFSENSLTMPNSQGSLVSGEDIGDIELSDAPPFGDTDIEEELKASSNGASKSVVIDKQPPKIEDMFDDDDDDAYGMSDGDDAKLFVETEAAMEFVPIGIS